jgi:hypothetical protein
MTFAELEQRFQQLRQQWMSGQIDQATFAAQVQALQLQDAQGRYWTIGVQTGQWYYFDGNNWLPGTPPASARAGETIAARSPLPPPPVPARAPVPVSAGGGTPTWLWAGCVGALIVLLLAVLGGVLLLGLGEQLRPIAPPVAIATPTAPPIVIATPIAPPTAKATPTLVPPQPADTATPPVAQPSPSPIPSQPLPAPSPLPLEPLPSAPPTPAVILVTATPTPTRPSAPASAPLEGKIAYSTFDFSHMTYDIYLLDVKSGTSQQVITEASQPCLRGDGQRLAYRSWKGDTRGLWVANVDGGGRERVSTFFEDGLPTWSPDGSNVIFFSRRESDRRPRLYIVAAKENVPDRTLAIGGGGEYPSYLPDGGLVFRGDINSRIGLYLGEAEGSEAKLFTDDDSDTAPAPSPDGTKIAFMSYKRDGNWETYLVNRDGSGLSNLTNNAANDGLPAWSPDGRYIAFLSDRDGQWAIWVMSADGRNPKLLHLLEGSADGRVGGEQAIISPGWLEERISWSP